VQEKRQACSTMLEEIAPPEMAHLDVCNGGEVCMGGGGACERSAYEVSWYTASFVHCILCTLLSILCTLHALCTASFASLPHLLPQPCQQC
jgi:hypothetical protein